MKKAILGKKVGMTQVFTESGTVMAVTVVEAGPCTVIRKKTPEKDGYSALCVGFDVQRESLANKPKKGEFQKAGVPVMRYVREFAFDNADTYEVGQQIRADVFSKGDRVDVVGKTRGRGYTGVIQRWNHHRGPMTHGSKFHRAPGSLSANTYPSRVFKGKGMAGQYGNERVTIQNLTIVGVDAERNLLLVSGAVPGKRGSLLEIHESVKQ